MVAEAALGEVGNHFIIYQGDRIAPDVLPRATLSDPIASKLCNNGILHFTAH